MGDPLNAAAVNNGRPVSWEKFDCQSQFDEISMSSPDKVSVPLMLPCKY